ncbi:hypothetical protein [Blastococcus xanthinilyticus]|uniref:Uncharacterized protein n=1 Tax=Blastococcus xanthinilyticus TaxID=1564164 RepID=A0A5S5CPX2_9ACTN|nr:hypothetical protein [Blastococcus xanthinilyticus]TYP82083.1 hypothetical protein BD833_12067 [Blastococcus xanthinilyticus]
MPYEVTPQQPGEADHAPVRHPIEPKVKAATVGGGAAGVVTAFVVWITDQLWFNGDVPPEVPFPIVSMVGLAAGAALPFAAGYYARHVNR